MIRISSLKPGQILYDVRSERMGNTTMRSVCVWLARIVTVNGSFFTASWNGNAPKMYGEVPRSWRVKKPTLVKCGWSYRLVHRGEKGKITESLTHFTLEPEAKG